jgi:hypothetical protein
LDGAQLLARRGVFKGIRDTMSTDLGTPALPIPRPRRWWVLRIVALAILVPAGVYGWLSPEVSWYRTLVPTGAAVFYGVQLRKAWGQRRRD